MAGLPLQLLPATVAGILYALRVHHLRRHAARRPGLAAGVLLRRPGADRRRSSPRSGTLADELFWAHMVEHLLHRRHRRAAARPRPHRAGAGAGAADPAASTACASWPTRSSRSRCGRSTSTSGTSRAARGAPSPRRRARAPALGFVGFGVNMWMALLGPAAQAGVVRQRRAARLHHRRAPDRRRARQRLRLRRPRLLRRLRGRRARARHLARRPTRTRPARS